MANLLLIVALINGINIGQKAENDLEIINTSLNVYQAGLATLNTGINIASFIEQQLGSEQTFTENTIVKNCTTDRILLVQDNTTNLNKFRILAKNPETGNNGVTITEALPGSDKFDFKILLYQIIVIMLVVNYLITWLQ